MNKKSKIKNYLNLYKKMNNSKTELLKPLKSIIKQ